MLNMNNNKLNSNTRQKHIIIILYKQISNNQNYRYLCLPHEPELEDINMASALDGLVACVVADVVLFVRLEQVAGTHGVAAL